MPYQQCGIYNIDNKVTIDNFFSDPYAQDITVTLRYFTPVGKGAVDYICGDIWAPSPPGELNAAQRELADRRRVRQNLAATALALACDVAAGEMTSEEFWSELHTLQSLYSRQEEKQ